MSENGSQFIVIEGLIGVGKTSLCRLLEAKRNAELVLEPADDNPFLAHFYSDSERFAFPAQMFYLASRSQQQNNLRQNRLFTNLLVADYLFEKDRLFAEQTLQGHEMDLYDTFSELLSQTISVPDFIVFLDSPTDVIMKRIERRGIDSEQQIEASYLNELRTRYYKLWAKYTKAPIYIVDTSSINYIDEESGQQQILAMIDGWLTGNPVEGAPEPYTLEEPQQNTLDFGIY
jgi:deoxyadenosine/deoxycytidine kinase